MEFEFLRTDTGFYKRLKGYINFKKICKVHNCLSLSKGKDNKCIKHQKNTICDMRNCKKNVPIEKLYCDKHNDINENYETKEEIIRKIKNKTKAKIKNGTKNNLKPIKFIKSKFWLNYYINNEDNISTKCQGICCAYHNQVNKPEGDFCKIENRFLCNLCKIF